MSNSPHSLDPAGTAAFLERLRRAGLADVEQGLREGRYEGSAAHAARSWVRIKKMEMAGRQGVAGVTIIDWTNWPIRHPARILRRILRKSSRVPLYAWPVMSLLLATAIILAGWSILLR